MRGESPLPRPATGNWTILPSLWRNKSIKSSFPISESVTDTNHKSWYKLTLSWANHLPTCDTNLVCMLGKSGFKSVFRWGRWSTQWFFWEGGGKCGESRSGEKKTLLCTHPVCHWLVQIRNFTVKDYTSHVLVMYIKTDKQISQKRFCIFKWTLSENTLQRYI